MKKRSRLGWRSIPTLYTQSYSWYCYPKNLFKRARIKAWLLPNLPCWEAKRSTKVLTCFDTVRHVVVYFVCLWRNRRCNTTNKFIRKDTEKGGHTNDKCNTVYFYDANMKCSDLPDRRNSLMGERLVYEVSANNLIKWIRKRTFRRLNRKTEWKANWREKKLSEQDLLRLCTCCWVRNLSNMKQKNLCLPLLRV